MMKKTVTERYYAIIAGICTSLILALSACGGSGGNALRDTAWELASLPGSDLLRGTAITIEFAGDEVSGSGGCNHYGGSYQSSGNGLSVSDIFSTEMGCLEPEGILEQEGAYLAALGAADSYQIAGDRLEIFDEAGVQILVFATPGTVSEEPTTQAVSEQPGTPAEAEPTESNDPESQESDLTAKIDVPTSLNSGVNVMADFTLTNTSSDGFYVLKWFTPIEGIAGDIFRVERDGAELPYRGKLVKRGPPISEDYVWLEAGESVSAEVDLAEGYDFSQAGQYTIQFRSPQISQVAKTGTDRAGSFEELGMIQIPSNTVILAIESEIADPLAASPIVEPPAGFKQYQDLAAGVSVFFPKSWIVSDVVPGQRAVLQSYPEDKYVGGEAPDPADTKCVLTIHPPDIDVAGYIQRLESSDPPVTIVSQGEIVLGSGKPGIRLEVDSMGRSVSLVTEINELTVVLTCNGELEPFDEIALTLTSSPILIPPENFRPYQDTEAGVAVFIPEAWVVSNVVPGQQAVLQSYSENKYVGGEAFEPGDTKCDLTIRPPDIDIAGHMQQIRSDSTLTIVSEQEIVLLSGRPGIRLEVDSMGRSVSLITEINELTVVLTCHGELAPFDEIAVTLAPAPVFGPPPGFRKYPDVTAGVSVFIPAGWIASGIVPGQSAILQSYPETRYVGGEALEPGDTKCDLTIRPPDIDVDSHMQELRNDSTVTIVSEQEIYLQSGKLGIRLEVESMGRSLSLITEVNERVVVLACFGELAPFDEIAVTISVIE